MHIIQGGILILYMASLEHCGEKSYFILQLFNGALYSNDLVSKILAIYLINKYTKTVIQFKTSIFRLNISTVFL